MYINKKNNAILVNNTKKTAFLDLKISFKIDNYINLKKLKN